MEMTIGSRRALTGLAFALATASALAATGLQFDPAITVSTNDAANNAFKAKMGWISYKSGPTQAQYDVKAQIMVYADGAAGGQNIWIARSVDNGASWGQQKITTSGGMSTGLIVDPVTPTNTGTFTINHNKPNIYVAPIGVINVGKGADALATWTSSDCSDTGNVTGDLAGPTPAQRINTNLALPQPFMCLWTARSFDGGISWVKQRLTDGSLDPDEDVPAGYVKYTLDTASTGGFAISYQADPAGLKLGEAEGPGEGASGAAVNPGTNIWYTYLTKAAFENAATPFPTPIAVSNNAGVAVGDAGASRANLAISGGTAVLAYEETKGGGSSGKQIIYHSFPYATPDANSAGTAISNPGNNARRVRFLLQGNEALTDGGDAGAVGATTKGVHVMLLWRETSLTTAAAASDIMMSRGIRNTVLRPGSTGFLPTDIEPFSAAKNLSDSTGDLGNDDNALAQRGVLRGEFAAIAYDRTPSKTQADLFLDTYNFFITRSNDGGVTWTAGTNMSNITDNAVRVVEPRLVGTPGTIKLPNATATSDPSDVQNGNILFAGWGTETNAAVSVPLDIYITRSTDKGATYEAVQLLAAGDTEQSEAQLRSPPDGKTLGALWMQRDASTNATDVMYRNGSNTVAVTVTKTGNGTGDVVSNLAGINCGAECSAGYVIGSSITLSASATGGDLFVGWLGPCGGNGTCTFVVTGTTTAEATFAPSTAGAPTLDIDASNDCLATSDALMATRYMRGLSAAQLVINAIGASATRTTDLQIAEFLANFRPIFDVDGNGALDAATDGVLLSRYLFGVRGAALVESAVGNGASRNNSSLIEPYLQGLCIIAPTLNRSVAH